MQARRYACFVSRVALSLVALFAAVSIPLGAADAGTHGATVRVVTSSPLAVRGTGFKAHERVRVTATPGGVRRVLTRADGRFTATYSTAVDRCTGLSVVAVGVRGDRAALKLPQPACPPPD
jgi:hypothetical protein